MGTASTYVHLHTHILIGSQIWIDRREWLLDEHNATICV